MKDSAIKTIACGSIRIDKKRFARFCTGIMLCCLYIAQKLIAIAGGISIILVACAGGDGKYYDGDIGVMSLCTVLFLLCLFSYYFLEAIMRVIIRKNNKRRR